MGVGRPELPRRASVVIIGGGIIGLSVAYCLARAGVADVVLVERDSLGQGSTSKAAGGVRAQFSDEVNIRLGQRSLEIFQSFGEEFDTEIDLHRVGYLFLLDNADDADGFARQVALQNDLGVPSRMIDVAEATRLSPMIDPTGLVAAAWSPEDGHCTPESVVLGYAMAARRLGVRIVTGCSATAITTHDDVITSVRTTVGDIPTDTVVCAAGAWSRQVADWVGVELPVKPLRRQIVVTEPLDPALLTQVPFTIDFSSSFYFHREGRGLLLGMSERHESWGFDLTRDPMWLEELAEAMSVRVPRLADVGIGRGWAGLYEMTPDHNALIGEADGVSRFLYAAGFSGHGFLMGPAVGEVVRDLVLGETPFVDVSGFDADRFQRAGHRPERYIV